jgi:hypothetical protein
MSWDFCVKITLILLTLKSSSARMWSVLYKTLIQPLYSTVITPRLESHNRLALDWPDKSVELRSSETADLSSDQKYLETYIVYYVLLSNQHLLVDLFLGIFDYNFHCTRKLNTFGIGVNWRQKFSVDWFVIIDEHAKHNHHWSKSTPKIFLPYPKVILFMSFVVD